MKIIINGEAVEIPSGSAGQAMDTYSTEETMIGTWIDGKPIYQKSFECISPNTDSEFVIVADAIQNIDRAIYCEFTMKVQNYHRFVCTSGWASQCMLLCVSTNGDVISVGCAAAYRNLPMVATVRYTKTTDPATQEVTA